MSTSIRRPRKRPRVASVNFRVLWWLVAQEAAYQLWRASWTGLRTSPDSRETYVLLRSRYWRRAALQRLKRVPAFRVRGA